MDLTENNSNHPNLISSAQSHQCVIGAQTFKQTIIIPSEGEVVIHNAVNFVHDLNAEMINKLCEYQPEVVILGTGENTDFPETEILAPLIKQQIGLEVLSNQAAARTFNILLAESRKVVCLMIINS